LQVAHAAPGWRIAASDEASDFTPVPMARELFAGVMSGTSLDGIDAVVADFAPASGVACETLGAAHVGLPTMLRDELLALQTPGANELARAGSAANMLAELSADAIRRALPRAKLH